MFLCVCRSSEATSVSTVVFALFSRLMPHAEQLVGQFL